MSEPIYFDKAADRAEYMRRTNPKLFTNLTKKERKRLQGLISDNNRRRKAIGLPDQPMPKFSTARDRMAVKGDTSLVDDIMARNERAAALLYGNKEKRSACAKEQSSIRHGNRKMHGIKRINIDVSQFR